MMVTLKPIVLSVPGLGLGVGVLRVTSKDNLSTNSYSTLRYHVDPVLLNSV